MTDNTVTSEEFVQDAVRAMRSAESGRVFVIEGGRTALVPLSVNTTG